MFDKKNILSWTLLSYARIMTATSCKECLTLAAQIKYVDASKNSKLSMFIACFRFLYLVVRVLAYVECYC